MMQIFVDEPLVTVYDSSHGSLLTKGNEMSAHITEFIAENEDGYFTAYLDDGGVRIGLRGCNCFAFPADHAEYARVVALRADQIEAAHDEFMGAYIAN